MTNIIKQINRNKLFSLIPSEEESHAFVQIVTLNQNRDISVDILEVRSLELNAVLGTVK